MAKKIKAIGRTIKEQKIIEDPEYRAFEKFSLCAEDLKILHKMDEGVDMQNFIKKCNSELKKIKKKRDLYSLKKYKEIADKIFDAEREIVEDLHKNKENNNSIIEIGDL